jgi:hypothetical protein
VVSYCYHGDGSGESIPDGDLPIAIWTGAAEVAESRGHRPRVCSTPAAERARPRYPSWPRSPTPTEGAPVLPWELTPSSSAARSLAPRAPSSRRGSSRAPPLQPARGVAGACPHHRGKVLAPPRPPAAR